MKNLLKTTVLMSAFILVALGTFAQGQFDAIKKLGEGEYGLFKPDGTDGKKTVSISFENTDDPRKFYLKLHWNKVDNYTMDEVAYGATLVQGGYIPKGFNYTRHRNPTKTRLLVIDEIIYYLQSYEGPEKFSLFWVFKKKAAKKKMSFKERLQAEKARVKGAMSGVKVDHDQIVKDFLKKEIAAQQVALPKWKAANKDYYAKIEQDKLKYGGMLKEDRKKRQALRNTQVTITNKTGRTIYIRGNRGFSTKIAPGEWDQISCKLATMYKSNSNNDKGAVLFEPSKYCGKSYVVKSW